MRSKRLDSIADYAREELSLRAECRSGRVALLDAGEVLRDCHERGSSKIVAQIVQRLRCADCGARPNDWGPAQLDSVGQHRLRSIPAYDQINFVRLVTPIPDESIFPGLWVAISPEAAMSDGHEGNGKWFLRYVIVPLGVVVLGAGATYYFKSSDSSQDDGAALESSQGEAGTEQYVPPPPNSDRNATSRTSEGGVRVEAPPSMGSRN